MGIHFLQKSEKSENSKNMKLFSILALATASHAYTVFEIGKDCSDDAPCGDNEDCGDDDKCACAPGWEQADASVQACDAFKCEDKKCGEKGVCTENTGCDCTAVDECKVEDGADPVCDALCAVIPPPETEETTAAAPEATTAPGDGSAFATLS